MPIVQLEHQISDFETWKKAFDSDPIDRKESGVRRYRIFRPVGNPHYVIVDLAFDRPHEAERFVAALRRLWENVEVSPALQRSGDKVVNPPRVRIVESVEEREYVAAAAVGGDSAARNRQVTGPSVSPTGRE